MTPPTSSAENVVAAIAIYGGAALSLPLIGIVIPLRSLFSNHKGTRRHFVFGGSGTALLLWVFTMAEIALVGALPFLVGMVPWKTDASTGAILLVVMALPIILAGRWIGRCFLRFAYFHLRQDGSWRLSNPWGVPLRTIDAASSPKVRIVSQEQRGGVDQALYTAVWVEVEAAGRVSRSLSGMSVKGEYEQLLRSLAPSSAPPRGGGLSD